MDNFDDLSAVNLSDDGDVKHFVSSKESDESDSMYHNIQYDQNVNSNMNIRDGEFKKITDLTTDDICGLEFGSEEEAYHFYEKYEKCRGFVVRKDEVKRNVNGKVIMWQFVCNRQGLRNKKHFKMVERKRNHRRITRVECQARLLAHNYELTPSRYVHLFPAYGGLTDADKAQVDSLHSYGTKTCHIMGYMVAQKGGYASVGFTKKDLYNYFDSQMRGEIRDGDVVAALSYLRGKADNDPMLYAKFATNSDGGLKQLFWADGCNKSDFLCFGDVLAFDMTYRKNNYNYPLVIFSGCNHHSQTVIFGCALVSDETIDTYKWVLKSFLEAMGNKHPKTVVTDGDGAMREAIKHVFPDTCHRLCVRHLHKNACENVKSSPFLMDFKKAMCSDFTPEQFEDFWMNMVEKHGLAGNKWVSKTYENRSSWATAYFRDIFFGRIRTTSQCEAINSIMKTYVRKKCIIFEFIHNFEQALREYRNNELVADFKSFCAMKEEHVDHIPNSLILTRWTKKAKIDFVSSDSSKGVDSDVMELARFGAYCGACTRFCKIASKKKGLYNEVMNDILKLLDKYEKLEDSVDTPNPSGKHFCDPNVIKTKGAPRKSKIGMKRSRHCSNCTSTKHNVKTCPMRVGTNAKSMNDDKLSQPKCPKSNITTYSVSFLLTIIIILF
uniref:Protein FAR1-RELATED SEQUENCE 5 n=1 Tax=Cajanus cajan TaxID=3821 RepID=A0A151UDJ3_CAJCA